MISPVRTSDNILNQSDSEITSMCNRVHTDGLVIYTDQDLSESDFTNLGNLLGEPEAPGLFMNPPE